MIQGLFQKYISYFKSEKQTHSYSFYLKNKRRNVLYVTLDTTTTIARHRQLENFEAIFSKHELVNSILINDYYLRGTDKEMCAPPLFIYIFFTLCFYQ